MHFTHAKQSNLFHQVLCSPSERILRDNKQSVAIAPPPPTLTEFIFFFALLCTPDDTAFILQKA